MSWHFYLWGDIPKRLPQTFFRPCLPGVCQHGDEVRPSPRSSVAVALRALEEAGLLTWVNRIARIRRRERDLFGRLVNVWQVIRISNGYSFGDPLDREPGRKASKSENPTRPQNRDLKQEPRPVDNPVFGATETADALLMRHGWFHGRGKEGQRA